MRFSVRSALRLALLLTAVSLLVFSLSLLWRREPLRFDVRRRGWGIDGYPFPDGAETQSDERAAAVIDVFRYAWHGYATRCFGHDEVLSVSGRCGDSRNGWGASMIDALSTAIIMGQKDIVEDVMRHIPRINFRHNGGWRWPKSVNLFETTIRYLGGLISAYDLLSDSALRAKFDIEDAHIEALLSQARTLADGLKFAFNTPSGVPYNRLWYEVWWHDPNQPSNSLAATGSLVLEWQRLSDLFDDPSYATLAHRAESHILNPHGDALDSYPGLLGTHLDISTGDFTDSAGSWGAGRDSAYEYLLKLHAYDPVRFNLHGERWRLAAHSTMTHMATHPSGHASSLTSPGLTFLADWSGRHPSTQSDHLTAFAGGNFILGGLVFNDSLYTAFGLQLVDSLHEVQSATASGLLPERIRWSDGDRDTDDAHGDEGEMHARTGVVPRDAAYKTRPELLESYYYAWRATRDEKYREWGWEAFRRIVIACKARYGVSGVLDVLSADPPGGEKNDLQDSYVFAELFKYAYLTAVDEDGDAGGEDEEGGSGLDNGTGGRMPWQLKRDGPNEFIFNTEGHPLRVWRDPEEDGVPEDASALR